MSIYKKLLEVQKEVGAISKDSKNPFFKSKYFDINQLIEHVQPVLNKHGLVLTQPIKNNVVYSVINDIDSDENVSSTLVLPEINDPQKIGSCITYYRRYTLASLLGLQAEDDDANLASKKVKKEKLSDDRFKKALTAIKEGNYKKEDLNNFDLSEEQKDQIKNL